MPARNRVDVARVQQLLAQGVTQTAVAMRLGISKWVVCQIANGKYAQARRSVA
jgi:DNA-binding XRE family transcriptional regulator